MLDRFKKALRATEYEGTVSQWFINRIMFSLLISALFVSLLYFMFYVETPLTNGLLIILTTIFLVIFVMLIFLLVVNVYVVSERKKREVESILPDFLFLVSSNLRARMSPMVALKTAARKEFGALSREINYATVKSLGTESFTEQLILIPKRLNSELLERVMMLFITGHVSGGNLAAMLEHLAYDIKETEHMRKRLYMGVNTYVLFIMISLLVGMPLLFAATSKFVEMSTMISKTEIDILNMNFLFIGMLSITSILAGIFSSVIRGGSRLHGLYRGVGYMIITVVLFNVFSYLIGITV